MIIAAKCQDCLLTYNDTYLFAPILKPTCISQNNSEIDFFMDTKQDCKLFLQISSLFMQIEDFPLL